MGACAPALFLCSRFMAQYIAGYDTTYPAGSIMLRPSQNIGSVSDAIIKPVW